MVVADNIDIVCSTARLAIVYIGALVLDRSLRIQGSWRRIKGTSS